MIGGGGGTYTTAPTTTTTSTTSGYWSNKRNSAVQRKMWCGEEANEPVVCEVCAVIDTLYPLYQCRTSTVPVLYQYCVFFCFHMFMCLFRREDLDPPPPQRNLCSS